MTYTICSPHQVSQQSVPSFDNFQFENNGRFLRNSGLDFKDFHRGMHMRPAAKTRRMPAPAWSSSDQELREIVLRYLESRFYIKNRTGTLQARLARCKAAGKVQAKATKTRCENWITEYRALANKNFCQLSSERYEELFLSALRGEPLENCVRRADLCVKNLDSESYLNERAAELVNAIVYYAYRLNWDSPSISEQLQINPPAIRQILHRVNRTAHRMAKGTPAKLGRDH
jgi:hypothetical protein